jgi:hypothetical protein
LLLTALIAVPCGLALFKAADLRSAIDAAGSTPHQDAIVAAHVPYGRAFEAVIDARRLAQLDAGRRAASYRPGPAAYDRALEAAGLPRPRTDAMAGMTTPDHAAMLPLLFLGLGRGEIPAAPSLPTSPSPLPTEQPSTPPARPTPGQAPGITYWHDAMPILNRECRTCHYGGGIAPFALESYADAKANADLIRWALAEGIMPPLPADPDKGKPFDDPRILSAAERKLLIQWVDDGAAEGDPKTAPPVEPPTRDPFGPPSVTVDIGTDYRPQPGTTDDYHCFIIDPGFTVDTEITMVDIEPQSAPMFHHGILYLAEPDDLADLRRLDRAEPGPGWTCFGGPGFNSSEWTAAEAVGALTRPYPAGTAKRIAAGSMFVLQQHYNTNNGSFQDRSKVHFWKAPRPIHKEPRDYRLVNPLFRIPAGAKQTRAAAFLDIVAAEGGGGLRIWPTARSGWLWRVWGHMHTLGDSFALDLIHKNGDRERLLDIPRWAFNWQGAYDLIDPVRVEPGDRVEMTCVWDNSPENQPLVGGVRQTPRDVTWGEGTLDEMCLGGVTLTD